MAKGAYIGVAGVARKVKKGYIGVAGVARKIKKAYIGIGGVARPCFGGGAPTYYGKIDPLDIGGEWTPGGSIGDYAIFCSGRDGTAANAYNKALTKLSAPSMPLRRSQGAEVSNSTHFIIAGGSDVTVSQDTGSVVAYDASLTRKFPQDLYPARYNTGAVRAGEYAVIGGGNSQGLRVDNVDAYNAALTRTVLDGLFYRGDNLGGASIGNYGLLCGDNTTVNVYNNSLTRSSVTCAMARSGPEGGRVGGYGLIICGQQFDIVDAYNETLTHTVATPMPWKGCYHRCATLENYLLIGGGNGPGWDGISSNLVTAYDDTLTQSILPLMQDARCLHGAATVGNAVLFGGGQNRQGGAVKSVEVYVI